MGGTALIDDTFDPAQNSSLIESNPAVMMGKPVISGTRITVEFILDSLAAGESVEQLLDAHPRLTREGIAAATTL